MKKALIIVPRLDISWKTERANKTIGKMLYPNIRKYWLKFSESYSKYLSSKNFDTEVKFLPLGGLVAEEIKKLNYDLILIPHRQKEQFDCGKNAKYYMQMVFPWLFSIDDIGWCAGSSIYPLKIKKYEKHINYDYIKKYCDVGGSKFEQKKNEFKYPEKFILFTIQVPNDMTIQYHSDVEVIDAMISTILFAKKINMPVLVKAHPGLKSTYKNMFIEKIKNLNWGQWIENVHILDCIRKSEAVVTVNSGTGMEAIMQNKPVFTFGRADYDTVSNGELTLESWQNKDMYIPDYKNFIETYCNNMFNVIEG